MSTVFHKPINNLATTLAQAHAPGSGALVVATGRGTDFGTPSAAAPVRVEVVKAAALNTAGEITDPADRTIYSCTGRSGDTLTVTAIEGTADQAFAVGDTVWVALTAGHISDLNTAVNTVEAAVATVQATIGGYGDIVTHTTAEFAAASHTHAIADVTGLQSALDGKSDTGHTHTSAEITDFAAAVSALIPADAVASVNGQVGAVILTAADIDAQPAGDYQPAGSYQTADADLDALAALATTGFAVRTAADTWTARSLTTADVPDLSGTYSVVGHTHSGLAPAGGTTGQVLKKTSDTDYDFGWASDSTGSGGGATSSGSAGAVQLADGAGGLTSSTALVFSGGSLLADGRVRLGGDNFTNVRLSIAGTQASADNAFGVYMGGLTLVPASGYDAEFQYVGGGTVDTGEGNTVAKAVGVFAERISKAGSGTIAATYAGYFKTSTSGTANYGGYFEGPLGVGTETPEAPLDVQGGLGDVLKVRNGLSEVVASIDADGKSTVASATIGSLTGLLKASSGVVAAATADTDYLAPDGDGSALTGITAGQVGAYSTTQTDTLLAAKAAANDLSAHEADTDNPHSVTSAQVGAYTSTESDTLLAAKAPLASPSFTGRATVPAHIGGLATATDGATVTFDLSASDRHRVTLGGDRTLALTNPAIGQSFTLLLEQDAVGTRTVTWFSGVRWVGGTTPTLTTTASKIDIFTFLCIDTGEYLGFVVGQNL